ncbi:MAG: hypothetical protein HKL79_03230 [Thermoplasmata archaeon]|nr:hypothetical protein [Thermoplasmata archaeon]
MTAGHRADLDRMRSLVATLPDQVDPGFRAGACLGESALRIDPSPVWFVGMGGSGIAGDLAAAALGDRAGFSLHAVRGPELPPDLRKGTVAVLSSYSGETWEVLRAYDVAGRRGATRVVFAAGGQLIDRAEKDGVPTFRLPPDQPPRTAVGSALGGLLGLVDAWLPTSNAGRITHAVGRTRRRSPRFASSRGPAAALARAVGDRTPYIYAGADLLPIARRWRTDIEENAKRLAMFDGLPEAFHHAVVGWDALPRPEAARWGAILLRWSGTGRDLKRGAAYLERLARSRGAFARTVQLPGDDPIEYLLNGIVLGGYLSLFLAERSRAPPLRTDAIDRLKAALTT